MKLYPLRNTVFLAAMVLLTAEGFCAEERQSTYRIATGGVSGLYYPVGSLICEVVESGEASDVDICSAETSAGSASNLEALATGESNFAIVQADLQSEAYRATEHYSGQKPATWLRTLFGLYLEPLTLVTREDAGVEAFADLKGKRVNFGEPGSGQFLTMQNLLRAAGWSMSDFAEVTDLSPRDQAKALCDGKIDAYAYMVGHPNVSTSEASILCSIKFVAIEGDKVEKLLADKPYYEKAFVPAETYLRGAERTPSFGTKALLVTSDQVAAEDVYRLTKAVFERLDSLKERHPALSGLQPDQMLEGHSAPFHEGAERYFRERGWIE